MVQAAFLFVRSSCFLELVGAVVSVVVPVLDFSESSDHSVRKLAASLADEVANVRI